MWKLESGLKNEVWLAGIGKPNQVAVDWITGNVYYRQQSSSIISVWEMLLEKSNVHTSALFLSIL